MPTQGILMFVFEKKGYDYAAINLAFSCKYHSPHLPITLYCDERALKIISAYPQLFDTIKILDRELYYPDGIFDPCNVKNQVYSLCPYDETLFLDVDTLCLQDLQPIFDNTKEDFFTHIYAQHTIDKGRDFPGMIWAWADDVWSHFNLPEDAVLPATNSSIQFWRKSPSSEILAKQIRENYLNKFPLNKLRYTWGGTQPDELYLNAAMAKLGWKQPEIYLFLGDKHSPLALHDIEKQFLLLSIYGGHNFTKLVYREWYDRKLRSYHKEKGSAHKYPVSLIMADKHANSRRRDNIRERGKAIEVPMYTDASFKITDSVLIPSSQLIQSYEYPPEFIKKHPSRRLIKVQNWFNNSFIEFQGRQLMAYRMEAQPYCNYTKLGICELDKDLNVIPGSNVLLNVHSALRSYSKGFHVEDPRLFIHNDELYLSYCDGYQMGQAKINPDTLQAEDSFYITKPNKIRTEKNWTFFSHNQKLYSVYQIAPHTVYEMNGPGWTKQFEEPFENSWKWGILRGGSSPVKTPDGWLSFFHSAMDIKGGRQYFMGAYLFSLDAPFAPIAISKKPILSGEAISRNIPRLSASIYVVFPGGVIRSETGWKVAFGSNDYECRYIEVSDEFLKESMEYIKQPEFIDFPNEKNIITGNANTNTELVEQL